MKKISILFLLIPFITFGQKVGFKEYKSKEFEFEGRKAIIVFPNKANKKKNWIWRARFWGHEPQLDKALLDKGFHVVYVDVMHLFGNQQAVNLWNGFYDYCRENYKLSEKVVLEGMSRGGLIIYNWAAQNTDKVACIYGDAPVCDIKSWPGGLYSGIGSAGMWNHCKRAYGLNTDEDVKAYKEGPIYNAAIIAKAKIPVIHVYGAIDEVVPYKENTALVEKQFEKA